ncbi:Y-family DNA polymerase [uncultured Finegoldia sp.]|uniref:Y-family DNA polymerase n=1 Tax=uncultured Finegoldia sp. TaxID=328009 RepID=UPI003420A4E0
MGIIDYSLEPKSDIAFVDIKSFYASVECVKRNLNPLTTSLCVMSNSDNAGGLILASSPTFKKVFGKKNVSRAFDLPFHVHDRKFNFQWALDNNIEITDKIVRYVEKWAENTLIVPPRMALYIQENLKIQKIFMNYASFDEILPYSIDEGFIDLTTSLNYFVPNEKISRKDKLDLISSRIQNEIRNKTGLYSTVGMSNANPLLAKLALDNEAKKTVNMRANWSYEDVEDKVWKIENLTDFWGIGERTKRRLNKLCIFSVKELANANPDILKKEFGIIGVQLWFHANGVDESKVTRPYVSKSKGLGNSQVLPRDYTKKTEIEIVLREIAEQVAIRIRRIRKKASVVSIYVGFSHREMRKSIHIQKTISPTQSTAELTEHVMELFRKKYSGGSVRRLAVSYENLLDESCVEFSIFDDVDKIEKQNNLEKAIDEIRDKYGFTSIQKATSLMEGSRVIERSKLIGGHCGGMDGTYDY